MLWVSMELEENKRHPIGFIELDGSELYNAIGIGKKYGTVRS
jgi:hypothetical protein